ncbi:MULTISPECIES: phospho-N-acetylmuramoyl-pentapeptide-transferase [Ruminococcus]|uniref:Phospho-N-acetylmuramoyl-pentapeptide-transferase n=1 Tax=Ruminococcus flavefaciens TaxID=1265 RepID=A0A315XZ95_RUMFL|nr:MULTISPECIES: phospho-N-acetylmuramoyl-pentapeptide-transferase [Ruminococcus]MBQ6169550.1 phospho-N-acetylmuramoyl-pentapeptide-transferase [Ruminococcus sp.]MBR1432070.1 phospho-N-acetylmuramoyl-pentapeptide-transferase [Ruminococcus sp.]PWJ13064.1 phospho-N-acetylmuramoyl-pentapeptide-transferase [Ruminococcus flavefaciens]SSA48657.1 Phospho-N-acetylmuramoyl-pentapeptide-transferase [Ruminococcus flavefaciens]
MSFWIIDLITALLSFVIAGVSGIFLVPFLHRIKFGQPIKTEDGPKWHAKKQGTPTMGGFMFIISTVITSIAGYWIYRWKTGIDTTDKDSFKPFYLLLSVLVFSAAFGLIGFIDDYTKVARKKNDGLTPWQKIALQLVCGAGFLFAVRCFGDKSTKLDLGFWTSPSLGIFYYILMMAVIIYLTNAVNLTDGVDGLCGSVTFVAMLIFTVCCSILKQNEMSCFTMALAGGCLGFLLWNLNPAKCFMGDTGSMFLGAAVTGVGLILHKHLLLLLAALVYIIEALSVMIQVLYFKYTKKKYGEGRRIFKMTPIHHHFEMSGFSEYKIVITFSLCGIIFGVLGIITLIVF